MLMTGVPGSGKTAHVVDLLAHDPQFKGRPLFQMGIPELQIDHQVVPPVAEWVELRPSPEDPSITLPYFVFPENAVIVIDEAQRVFRPRPQGSKVPPEVQAFETHRHTGVDFILITQHPNLIDSNVRKLISRHLHVLVNSFGRVLLDWPRIGEVDSRTDRDLATRKRYKPPKRVFSLYKSAEAHTVIKRKLPWQFWLAIGCAVAFLGVGYYTVTRISAKTAPKEPDQESGVLPSLPTVGAPSAPASAPPVMTKAAYLEARMPRLAGLHHTAPLYDNLTTPADVPWPSLCVIVEEWQGRPSRCRCLDQQGNDYGTTDAVCRSFATKGYFKDWQPPQQVQQHPAEARTRPARPDPPEAAASSQSTDGQSS
jgi:zona occludens toxin